MHVHILGICGTFMGGIALLAKEQGHKVTGCDANVYPPMSDELAQAGIEIHQGFDAEQLDTHPDLIVVGNVMKRGMPVIERMLNERLDYVSGPEFLENLYLKKKTVLAVAGTHGKTTTSSMLAWILYHCGKNPGFLIGGIPENFGYSARGCQDSEYFVIEADEYDCSFFDKRSKFVHYHPDIAIINKIEFDHADIFNNINEIEKQFHHMIRTIPSNGAVIYRQEDVHSVETINLGLWSKDICVGRDDCPYRVVKESNDASVFSVYEGANKLCTCTLQATGEHNMSNAFMAMLAAQQIGISIEDSAKALELFKMPKRRMELVGSIGNIKVYDDFAHHPTAIATTIDGLRQRIGQQGHIICVFEPRSNSMKMGANREELGASFNEADEIFIYQNESVHWDMSILERDCAKPLHICHGTTQELIDTVVKACHDDSNIIVMSNGGFENVKGRLVEALKQR